MAQGHELETRASSDNHKPSAVHSAEHDVATTDARDGAQQELGGPPQSPLVRFYSHPWTQILLISFICFCLPGVRPSAPAVLPLAGRRRR